MGLAKRIIPCLDVAAGRVVKGVNFVNLRDAGDPVEVARRYDEQGADELAFLDIRASIETRGLLYDMIEAVADQVFIPLTVGGGVRTVEDIRALLNAGADKVSINTAGVQQSRADRRGGRRTSARSASSPRSTPSSARVDAWEVYTHGGRTPTGIDAVEWAREVAARGAGEILLTSMDRDGTRTGFDLALTRAVVDAVDVPVIASGGVGTLAHLVDGISVGGADAVLAASIFHYGEFTIGAGEGGDGRRGIEMRTCDGTGMDDWLDDVRWNADGLVPAIAQDAATRRVLTLAWMNREALARTAATRRGALLVALARAGCGARARRRATCSACARSASIATATRSCSSSSRSAASPATPAASAASSSGSTTARWHDVEPGAEGSRRRSTAMADAAGDDVLARARRDDRGAPRRRPGVVLRRGALRQGRRRDPEEDRRGSDRDGHGREGR